MTTEDRPMTQGHRSPAGIVDDPLDTLRALVEQNTADMRAVTLKADVVGALLTIARALPASPWMSAHPSDIDQRDICFWCFGRAPVHATDCLWLAASTAKATLP